MENEKRVNSLLKFNLSFDLKSRSFFYAHSVLYERYLVARSLTNEDFLGDAFAASDLALSYVCDYLICTANELLFKSILHCSFNEGIDGFRELEKKAQTHALKSLKKEVDEQIRQKFPEDMESFNISELLLEKATRIIEWAARYPYPKNVDNHKKLLLDIKGAINYNNYQPILSDNEIVQLCQLYKSYWEHKERFTQLFAQSYAVRSL